MGGRVRELAGIVADGGEVDWSAVERRAAAPDRTIANLRLLERLAEASGARSLYKNEAHRARLSSTLAPWEAVLLLVAALRALVGILAPLVQAPARGRDLTLIQLAVAGACLAASAILLRGGGGDRRSVALAGVMLTAAAATAWPAYSGLSHRFLTFDPLLVIQPESFLAYWTWAFVAVFPRRRVESTGDRAFVTMRRIALFWGAVLMAANAAASLWAPLRPSLRPFDRGLGGSVGFWGVIGVMTLLAPPAMAVAARRADRSERRRTAVFMAAIAFGFVPLFVVELAAMIFQRATPSSRSLALELLPALTVPFTTTYGVLAKRVLPLRSLIHQMGRYLLAWATVNLAVALPVLGAVLLLAVHRDKPIALVLAGPLLWWLGALALMVALTALARHRLLAALDRAFNRESQDWHGRLAEMSQGVAVATTVPEMLAAVHKSVARPLGAASMRLLRAIDEARSFIPLTADTPALTADSGNVLLTFAADAPLSVDPEDPGSMFWWLREEDRCWIVDTDASVLIPMRLGARQCGLLVIGSRRAERKYERDELQFLSAVASSLAASLDRLANEPVAPQGPAFECVACGRTTRTTPLCECGTQVREAQLPLLLAGRYQLEKRLGQGAMGVVYQATDLELGRRVALKTLPDMSAEASVRLRNEARSMAGVSHPSLAVLYDIERWDSRPVLVEEYMGLGTLADRLSSPIEADQVVRIGTAVAAALAALHERSLIHRDIKPSNIGFTEAGEPKVLDLGLAELVLGTASRLLGGTPRYVPPEAWRGNAIGAEGDLWALAMVLYESLAGEHPFAGRQANLWRERLEGLTPPNLMRGDCPAWLSDLVMMGLSRDPSARWPSAAWIHDRLIQGASVQK